MAREGKTKKPKKGIRYIAQKLRKYYPKRYKNYNEALVKARVVFTELNSRQDAKSKKVNLRNIFSVERIPKKPKDEFPEIPEKFFEANYFYEVGDVFEEIRTQLPNNVFVESKISKTGLPILQGFEDNALKIQEEFNQEPYELYFKDFVEYGNKLLDLSGGKTSDYVNLFYTFTTPIRKNGKWVMYLISCDQDSIKCDFGFDPDEANLPDQFIECPTNYEDMPYNTLRTEAKKQGIKFKKSPTKKHLVSALKKTETPPPPKDSKTSKKSTESDSIALEKEKQKTITSETKKIEAEAKKIAEENRKKELDIRQQELDMEKIQYGIMTVAEFKKKWK
jgi:hypothetical protein